jgi:hypothetical protein
MGFYCALSSVKNKAECYYSMLQSVHKNLTISLSSGDKDVVFSYKLFLDENHQYHGHDKSLPLNRCLELHVKNYNSLVLNHLLQSQTSEDSDVDLFLEL